MACRTAIASIAVLLVALAVTRCATVERRADGAVVERKRLEGRLEGFDSIEIRYDGGSCGILVSSGRMDCVADYGVTTFLRSSTGDLLGAETADAVARIDCGANKVICGVPVQCECQDGGPPSPRPDSGTEVDDEAEDDAWHDRFQSR